jgi:hypothetical protein
MNSRLNKLEHDNEMLKERISALETVRQSVGTSEALAPPIGAPVAQAAAPVISDTAHTTLLLNASRKTELEGALALFNQAQTDLLAYYEGDEPILSQFPQISAHDDTKFVAKIAKIIQDGQNTFVVAVVGSSMSAAHDNWMNASFGNVLQRRMKPLWAAIGVDFIVRSAAVGGRSPNPWPLCMKQMVGSDVDAVIYENEFWTFEAGFSPEQSIEKEGQSRVQAGAEIVLRNVFRLPHQPALHFLRMGPKTGSVAWVTDWIHPPGPLSAYASFPINAFDAFGAPFAHLAANETGRIRKAAIPNQALGRIPLNGDIPWQKALTGDAALKFEPCSKNQMEDIAQCPVNFFKQGVFRRSSC